MNEGTRWIRLHGWPATLALAAFGALLVLLGLLWAAQPVRADTLTVENTNNDGANSLRAVVNGAADGDIIEFAPSIAGATIDLTEPITISQDIEIRGGNAITVSGGDTSRIFRVDAGANVTFSGLRLRDGFAELDGGQHKGGAIYNSGVVTLTDSMLMLNRGGTGSETQGGAIHNSTGSTLYIIDSTITTNNTTATNADTFVFGGAIFNAGTLDITTSTISDNIAQVGGGQAQSQGGAIHNNSTGVVTITQSTIANNLAGGIGITDKGGGIYNVGTMTIESSTISENTAREGAGIFNMDGELNVLQSAVLTNTATVRGGGVMNSGNGTTAIINTTFTGNSGDGGSAVRNDSSTGLLRLTYATVAGNTGDAALFNAGDFSDFTFQNTIIANNSGNNCSGTDIPIISSQGHTIADDGTCALTGDNDLPNTDPQLGPLSQDADETTLSFKPLANSPAIDAGRATIFTSIDQRGIARPQGADPEIGSVELPLDLAVSKTSTPDTVRLGDIITYTISFTNNSSLVTATNVLIDDPLPQQVKDADFSTASQTPTVTRVPGSDIQWTIDTLGPGESNVITITGNIGGPPKEVITNTVTICDRGSCDLSTDEPDLTNNTASVTNTVITPAPTPPTANDDEAFTQINTPITIDVLANDTDPANDPLTIVRVGDTTAGSTVLISASTELVYTPTLDFIGTDVFTYTVADPLSLEDTATVTVTVAPEGVEPGEAVLEVSIAASADPVQPGDALAYTIDVTNNGPEQATSLTATLTISSGLTFDTASGTDWTCTHDETASEVTCLRDSLAVNDTGQIVVNTTVAELTTGLAATVGTLDATVEVRAANSPTDLPAPSDSVSVTLEDGLQRLYLPLVSK